MHANWPPALRLAAEGRDAQTVYRDRATGRVVTQQEFAETRGKAKGRDDKPKMVEVHLEWKGGLAQRREAEERAARMAAEVGGRGGEGGGGCRSHSSSWPHTACHVWPAGILCRRKGGLQGHSSYASAREMLQYNSNSATPFPGFWHQSLH
jgi:hypothetical protein